MTEKVRRKPYSVILLDEIEKAHPDVFNILLQVLDDGRMTDNKGRTADFKNCIIIMTSNLGSAIIQENLTDMNEGNRDSILAQTKQQVFELLRKTIRPEFLNRIDEIIMFNPLTRNEIAGIVRIQIGHLQKMLEKNDIHITMTEDAVNWIAELGFDPHYGARPMKRVLQRKVLNELSKMILSGQVTKDSEIVVDAIDRQIVFYNKQSEASK